MTERDDEIEKPHDVFISYAHEDADNDVASAKRIAEWLESEGYNVWWDRHLLFGDFGPQLERKASKATKVIVLWSPRAAKSKFVFAEGFLAANRGTLAPIIIEEHRRHPLPESWAHFHSLRLTNFEAQKVDILRMLPVPNGHDDQPVAIDNAAISIAGLPTSGGMLIGRKAERTLLVGAWASTAPGVPVAEKINVVIFHAIGGAGKTALMRNFVDNLADEGFAGAEKIFGWSAYSQGLRDNCAASADAFIAQALGFFGHDVTNNLIIDPVERGHRLASLAGARRNLLIIDGLEPLQDPLHINGGRLKDRGLSALITSLSAKNSGLLVITSRQQLPEVAAAKEPRVISRELNRLDIAEGVSLLAHLGVHGKRSEMEKAVDEVLGHALSLNLLGSYLDAVHGGDVMQREQLKLDEIVDDDADVLGDDTTRYARRAAQIAESTVARFGALPKAHVELAVLNMVGLFERPADQAALKALLDGPQISGLTEAFQGLSSHERDRRWNVAVTRLRKMRLLNAADKRDPRSLDSHPIIRAHFGGRLKRQQPRTYREAHGRLYDFYRYWALPAAFHTPEAYKLLAYQCIEPKQPLQELAQRAIVGDLNSEEVPKVPRSFFKLDRTRMKEAAALIGTAAYKEAEKKFLPNDLVSMQPCFFAIAHGCAAGRHQEAYLDIYVPRVRRGSLAYVHRSLGARSANLSALSHFFAVPWELPAEGLDAGNQISLLNYAAFTLRSLGRLRESSRPLEIGLDTAVGRRDWGNAADAATGLSQLRLRLGNIDDAIAVARDGIVYADLCNEPLRQLHTHTALADALHQAGDAAEALASFLRVETTLKDIQLDSPELCTALGYRLCSLLLASGAADVVRSRLNHFVRTRRVVDLVASALAELVAGGIDAMKSKLRPETSEATARHFLEAVEGLRRAGTEDILPHGLLARAAFRRQVGYPDGAAADLQEVFEIANRSETRLHLADYHLEAARLCLTRIAAGCDGAVHVEAETRYSAAQSLIGEMGYKRRLPELQAIRGCLDGKISADILGPDRDAEGRPSLYWLQSKIDRACEAS